MRKVSVLALVVVMVIAVLAGCGTKSNIANSGTDSNAGNNGLKADVPSPDGNVTNKNISIKMFQFKVEIKDALQKMVEEYEKETGVHIDVETHGGGEDYSALLRAEIASGSEPEIFNTEGFAGLAPYLSRADDLSNEPWAKDLVDVSRDQISVDGKLYGMPMNLEGYGFIYNKDLFAKAGITTLPKTLDELEADCKELQDAGITPFSTTGEWWVLGIHLVNIALASQPDPAQFIADVQAGNASFVGNEVFENWVKLVDIMVKYGAKNPLTVDYNTQVADFAAGKYAMLKQGNWIQGMLDAIDPDLNISTMPIPIDNSGEHDFVFSGVPNNWIVNKQSAHPEEAKKFLNWMVTSETGKKFITHGFQFIPSFSTIVADPDSLGPIGAGISEIKEAHPEKVKPWVWARFPDGVTQDFGSAMQQYVGGQINKDSLLDVLTRFVQDGKK